MFNKKVDIGHLSGNDQSELNKSFYRSGTKEDRMGADLSTCYALHVRRLQLLDLLINIVTNDIFALIYLNFHSLLIFTGAMINLSYKSIESILKTNFKFKCTTSLFY